MSKTKSWQCDHSIVPIEGGPAMRCTAVTADPEHDRWETVKTLYEKTDYCRFHIQQMNRQEFEEVCELGFEKPLPWEVN